MSAAAELPVTGAASAVGVGIAGLAMAIAGAVVALWKRSAIAGAGVSTE
ncbi:LPXTG cell wall anchor domain-containing protein [Agrococcus sp. DT81.2]